MKSTAFFRVHFAPLQHFFYTSIKDYFGGWTGFKTEIIGQASINGYTAGRVSYIPRGKDVVHDFLLLESGDVLLKEDGTSILLESSVVGSAGFVLMITNMQDRISGQTVIKDDIVAKVRMPAT